LWSRLADGGGRRATKRGSTAVLKLKPATIAEKKQKKAGRGGKGKGTGFADWGKTLRAGKGPPRHRRKTYRPVSPRFKQKPWKWPNGGVG